MPTRRFDHIHVDLVGPLPPSNGSRYLFTVIDRFTRWPAAYPLQDMETSSCARALRQWISDFGVPSDISSDRGTQFTGQLWKDLTQLLGIQLHHTTSYHPQANGIVERFHRSLKASIMARMTTETWSDELPWVMLGLRTAPKPDLGVSPAELVYGAPLALPAEFLSGQPDPDTPAALLHRIRERIAQIAPIHGIRNPFLMSRQLLWKHSLSLSDATADDHLSNALTTVPTESCNATIKHSKLRWGIGRR